MYIWYMYTLCKCCFLCFNCLVTVYLLQGGFHTMVDKLFWLLVYLPAASQTGFKNVFWMWCEIIMPFTIRWTPWPLSWSMLSRNKQGNPTICTLPFWNFYFMPYGNGDWRKKNIGAWKIMLSELIIEWRASDSDGWHKLSIHTNISFLCK